MKGATDVRFEGICVSIQPSIYPADGLHDGQAATTSDGCIEIEDSQRHSLRKLRDRAHRPARHLVQKRLRGFVGEALPPARPRRRRCVLSAKRARPNDERVNHHIVVDDCIIQHGGRLHPSACGVVVARHAALRGHALRHRRLSLHRRQRWMELGLWRHRFARNLCAKQSHSSPRLGLSERHGRLLRSRHVAGH